VKLWFARGSCFSLSERLQRSWLAKFGMTLARLHFSFGARNEANWGSRGGRRGREMGGFCKLNDLACYTFIQDFFALCRAERGERRRFYYRQEVTAWLLRPMLFSHVLCMSGQISSSVTARGRGGKAVLSSCLLFTLSLSPISGQSNLAISGTGSPQRSGIEPRCGMYRSLSVGISCRR